MCRRRFNSAIILLDKLFMLSLPPLMTVSFEFDLTRKFSWDYGCFLSIHCVCAIAEVHK